jgi:RNA-directed DNA polymerase
VLDADLKVAFDRIDHHSLLAQLGGFPAREQVEDWLRVGVVGQRQFTLTEEGTSQGGVGSPLLLNVALCGEDPIVASSAAVAAGVCARGTENMNT